MPSHWSPVHLLKFPILRLLTSSGFKKGAQICVSAWSQGLKFKTRAEVSSRVPHLVHKTLLICPIVKRCLLRVLCPVKVGNSPGLCFVNGQYPVFSSQTSSRYQLSSLFLGTVKTPHFAIYAAFPCNILSFFPSKYCWTSFGTLVPMETLFWQPEVISEPSGSQRKY